MSENGVLIIDDECLIAEYVATVLEEEGITVAGTAGSAAEARAIFAERRPAALICDIRLGPDDGIALAQELRARRDVPVVFVSGFGDPAVMQRIEAMRPAGFLQKPLLPQHLVQAVREILAEAA